jgi:type II secretory pathway component PulF
MSTVPSMTTASHRLPWLALVVAARSVLWVAWLSGVLLWAPRVENVLRRMNLRANSSAEFVFTLAHGLVPLGLLAVLVIIALDGTVSYRLRRMVTGTLWSALMTIAPVVAMILTALAVSRPMLLVLENITK